MTSLNYMLFSFNEYLINSAMNRLQLYRSYSRYPTSVVVCMSASERQRGRAFSPGGRDRYGDGREEYDRNSRFKYKKNRPSHDGPKSDTKTLKDGWQGDVVYGTSPVLAALDANRRTLHAIYVQEGSTDSKRKESAGIQNALSKAQAKGVPLVTVSKHDLNMITNNRPHQGIVLDASHLSCEKMDKMPVVDSNASSQGHPVWLCLDEITDPQNLGAVIRSAYFLGASGVLLCSRNSAPLSGVVSKSSAGALEKMTIYSCRSLPTTLTDARSKGWSVIGASADQESIPCEEYKLASPTILVMGSEGYGLRTTVRRTCDNGIRISGVVNPTQSGLHDVDSLNVSVATGILLHSLVLQRKSG